MFKNCLISESFLKGVKKENHNPRFKFRICIPPPVVSVKTDSVCFSWKRARFTTFACIYCVCEVKAVGSESS